MKLNEMWEAWPADIHTDFEQVKRIEASKKLSKKIASIDKENGVVQIQGSAAEPYTTTLSECDCQDFIVRQAPCKHMYCLASELGFLKLPPACNKKVASFDPEVEMKRYRELYIAGQISADAYTKVCSVLAKIKK